MSISVTFQPKVNELIATLEEFCTGAYLKEEEKEFWEQPFDLKALPELRTILEQYLEALDALGKNPEQSALHKVAKNTINELEQLNSKYFDAVIEPEEKQEISDLMFSAAQITGADELCLTDFPEFE